MPASARNSVLLPEPLAPEIRVEWPCGRTSVASRQQRLAVGQSERQTLGADIGPAGLGRHVDRRVLLVVDGALQAHETIHHRAQLGQGGVVVDEEGQRRLDLAERLGRLRHDAEGDGAGEEARAGHEIGEDDGDLGVARLVEGELQAGVEHAPAVLNTA